VGVAAGEIEFDEGCVPFVLLLELKLLEKVVLAVGGGRKGEEIRWVESSEWRRPGGSVLPVGGVSVGGWGWQTRKKSLHRSQWTVR
jgi:hypothetical protein